ncbi:hypothetical protein G3A44_09320 [Ideonella sp. TBM-1]|uniref:Exonuclease domain-containing protein n=1 Tax=Ideonella livida TaxID=2707176 RepID=A0A7C9PHJ4_9BURK|nr:hypothetical protein [Ideonella livida]
MTPPPLPCVIDVEASGFGRGSYPIEVGVVLEDGQAWCSLVRPAPDWTHWDEQAERLHGLSRPLLSRHGRPAREVALALNHHLRGRAVHTDAWAHDYPWLARLFDEAGLLPAFRLHHLHALFTPEQAAGWDDAVAQARVALGPMRHRASNDARVLQHAAALLLGLTPVVPRGAALSRRRDD